MVWIKIIPYISLFTTSLLSSASIIFLPIPISLIATIEASIKNLNPLFSIISLSIGAAIGEFTSYFLGIGATKVLEKKHLGEKRIMQIYNLFERYGFLAIFVFAALPLPFDIVGILAGTGKYDVKKFFIATFLGKLVKFAFIFYITKLGIRIGHELQSLI